VPRRRRDHVWSFEEIVGLPEEAAMAKTLDARVKDLERKVKQLESYIMGLDEELNKLRDDLEDHVNA